MQVDPIVGLLGGSSYVSTVWYYDLINKMGRSGVGGFYNPRIITYSMNFAEIEKQVHQGLWDELGDDLAEGAQVLEKAGAKVILFAANTGHRVAARFTSAVSVKVIHIADPVTTAIREMRPKLKCVGLLGTKQVMGTEFMQDIYREKAGVEVIVPTASQQDTIEGIIFGELVDDKCSRKARAALVEITAYLHKRGAKAIVKGCTEFSKFLRQRHTKVPLIDPSWFHCKAAVDFVLALRESSTSPLPRPILRPA